MDASVVVSGAGQVSAQPPSVRLTRILSDHPAAVLLVDLDAGSVVYANRLAAELAPDVALPAPVEAWSRAAGLLDDDGEALGESPTPLHRIAAGDPVTGEVVTARRASEMSQAREQLWVVGTPLTGAPAPLSRRALVVFLPLRDSDAIDAVQRAGQDLRERAVMASHLSFSISDPRLPDDPLVWVNPAFEQTTGYLSQDVLGTNCRFLQGPATDPAAVDRIRQGLKRGDQISETLLNYRADGTVFWNHVVISPIYDDSGVLTHHVGVQTDVTDRVAADHARDRALDAARIANQRLTRLSTISELLGRRLAVSEDLSRDLPDVVAGYFDGWVIVTTDGPTASRSTTDRSATDRSATDRSAPAQVSTARGRGGLDLPVAVDHEADRTTARDRVTAWLATTDLAARLRNADAPVVVDVVIDLDQTTENDVGQRSGTTARLDPGSTTDAEPVVGGVPV